MIFTFNSSETSNFESKYRGAQGLDPEKILDNITVARAYNSAHQMLILEEAGTLIKESNIKLIVADSAVGLFRSEYLGRGTLATRQQKLNRFVHTLVRLAETYNCAALATNQVMSSPDTFLQLTLMVQL